MSQEKIIDFLLNPASYPHSVAEVQHIETHISHIFLCGEYAYKLKKALRYDFCDFSTTEKRRYFCERELALNKRYAPELYERVVTIYQRGAGFGFDSGERELDSLVCMKRFASEDLFDAMLKAGRLLPGHIVELVNLVSRFHATAEPRSEFWGLDQLSRLQADNFRVCQEYTKNNEQGQILSKLEQQTQQVTQKYAELIQKRQFRHVKELHGDLHLGNICLFRGRATPFDGIEFGALYSCCDVWADFAFLFMDLIFHDRSDLAYLALNKYLANTNDFEGLRLLPLYASYRAMVRAKVDALGSRVSKQLSTSASQHILLAAHILDQRATFVIALGGFSGSGKSSIAQVLAEQFSAVLIRSDVQRKHLAGVVATEHLAADYYSQDWSERTYAQLLLCGRQALQAGYSVVFDAVHSTEASRLTPEQLAEELKIPFLGLWCEVSEAEAIRRVSCRTGDASDADASVVRHQYQKNPGKIRWNKVNTDCSLIESIQQAVQITQHALNL